jgi:hypothetical protein
MQDNATFVALPRKSSRSSAQFVWEDVVEQRRLPRHTRHRPAGFGLGIRLRSAGAKPHQGNPHPDGHSRTDDAARRNSSAGGLGRLTHPQNTRPRNSKESRGHQRIGVSVSAPLC